VSVGSGLSGVSGLFRTEREKRLNARKGIAMKARNDLVCLVSLVYFVSIVSLVSFVSLAHNVVRWYVGS